jgi:hypothetical protein
MQNELSGCETRGAASQKAALIAAVTAGAKELNL